MSLCHCLWVPLRSSFNVLLLLKYICIPYFLQMYLMLLHRSGLYGMTMCPLYLFVGPALFWLFVVLLFGCVSCLMPIMCICFGLVLLVGSVVQFLIWSRTNCFDPMHECIDATKFCSYVVVAFPL